MFDLETEVQKANRDFPGGCPACKGIRFKSCHACGQSINSFRDHRDGGTVMQMYPRTSDWREVNGTPEQDIPDRRLQP